MSDENAGVEVVEEVGGSGSVASGAPPPNYLAFAIVTTILCCWPLGIPAIIFACQVNGKHESGDHEGAMQASKKAKLFSILALCGGGLIVLIWLLMTVISIIAGAAN
ncbi:MAG: CD225/dispanin family protein [Victivallales bacterium]|nr:CD225/dispanin family protein [Victivallales bacterium]